MKNNEQHQAAPAAPAVEDIIRPPRPRALTLATTPDLKEWTTPELTARAIALQKQHEKIHSRLFGEKERLYRLDQAMSSVSIESDPEIIAAELARVRAQREKVRDLEAQLRKIGEEHKIMHDEDRRRDDMRYAGARIITEARR